MDRVLIPKGWEPQLEDVQCDLCGSEKREVVMIGSDFRYSVPGRFPLQKCLCCGLVYLSPRPAPNSLSHYYPQGYSPHGDSGSEHAGRYGVAVRQFIFRGSGTTKRALAWLYNSVSFRAFPPSLQPGRVLDVGCGSGSYLRVCRDLGWDVEGVEPSAEVAERARRSLGVQIHTGFIEDIKLQPAHYDLITFVHSLEHTRSPRRVLQITRNALRPGGALLIMVPNFAAWDRRIFGERWYGLEIPRHLYHFEPSTLTALLHAEAYTVDVIGGCSHPDVVLRNVRLILGRMKHDHKAGTVERLLSTLLLFPLAVVRRSTSLWGVARRPF